VFLEPVPRAPKLAVVGATPVALQLLRIGGALGYECVLIEERGDRITPKHRRAARAGVFESAAAAALDSTTDLVHTDHDTPGVTDDLAAALEAEVHFVGIMGSRRHTSSHLAQLAERGFSRAQIERIESPVGIALGARSPAEIAVSIAAGLVAARRGTKLGPGSDTHLEGTLE
jgi:xanthine dehydrogenase accessory factor